MFEPGLDFNISGQLALDVAETVDEFEVKAGILTLRLPKRESVKPKRIPILGKGRKMIEGK